MVPPTTLPPVRAHARGAAATALLTLAAASCGGDSEPPSVRDVAECLRKAGASVDVDPKVSDKVGDSNFAPVLTPDTRVAARGSLAGAGSRFFLYESTKAA